MGLILPGSTILADPLTFAHHLADIAKTGLTDCRTLAGVCNTTIRQFSATNKLRHRLMDVHTMADMPLHLFWATFSPA